MKILLMLLAMALAGCATLPPTTLPVADDNPVYTARHPYYAEMCALTEIDKKSGFGADIISGGPGGHSVLYLNGVCRDRSQGYPVIGLCDPAHGVGLSANAHFSNANWVAVDGRDFLFDGNLDPGQPLTRDAYAATQIKAKAQGIYDGVTFHDEVFQGILPGVSREDWKYEVSAGTDYATGFARSRYCARVPLSQSQMQRTVRYFNNLNAPYRKGEKQFQWSVFHDNCSHMTHDALAAACEWNEWPKDQSFLAAAIDFPVPKNEFVDLMRRGNDMDLADPVAVFRDESARRDLLDNGRLPTEPGVLADIRPVIQQNAVYGTNLSLIFYDDPVLGDYQPRFDEILAQPRYSDLQANLDYFAALYASVEAARRPLADYLPELAPEDRPAFAAFYGRYYSYIHGQIEAVRTAPRQSRP